MTDLKLPQLSYLTLKKRPAHYTEPDWHWYYAPKKNDLDWKPLSIKDSNKIESEFRKNAKNLTLIAIEGNRYDISIGLRKRYSVYWDSEPTCIRRCLWFYKVYKHLDYSPFEENISEKLEQEYRNCMESNRWNVKIQLPDNKGIVDICAPDEIYHYYSETNNTRTEKNISSFVYKPTIVRRGFKGVKFTLGESDDVDHLLFIVHGIGPGCDLKFHTIAEVVDEFRTISYQLIDSHYQLSIENGLVNRIEILPISWYHELHSEYTDQKLREITLKSMPRLRDFTNSTLLDILFYTSPVYAQKISNTVGNEMNRLSNLFRQRNSNFNGSISLGGHSLGSLIIFDILCHQKSGRMRTCCTKKETDIKMKPQLKRRMSKMMGYALGVKGAGQPRISYPQLNFEPNAFFALGSPIAMFVSIRGIDFLGENFSLPTCKSFFNIFHPYDPIAYRLEPLINSTLKNINPVLIPHHKGRKRMHLEVKEMMYRLGSDVKQMIYDTWSSMTIPTLINRILNQSWSLRHKNETNDDENGSDAVGENFLKIDQIDTDDDRFYRDSILGSLNNGRRIDYTLQEAPIEILNEYIFAFQSHVCYWDSHDTVLLIINEIYNSLGIVRDNNDNIQEEI